MFAINKNTIPSCLHKSEISVRLLSLVAIISTVAFFIVFGLAMSNIVAPTVLGWSFFGLSVAALLLFSALKIHTDIAKKNQIDLVELYKENTLSQILVGPFLKK